MSLPLLLWGIMRLTSGVVAAWAGAFLSMLWPGSFALISPSTTGTEILLLLLFNVVCYAVVGFLSTKWLKRSKSYFALLAVVLLVLFLTNGGFVWILLTSLLFDETAVPLVDAVETLHMQSFLIVAATVTLVFIVRWHRATPGKGRGTV